MRRLRLTFCVPVLVAAMVFAVAAPLIGPALDRRAGGRRWVVFGAAAARTGRRIK